MYIKFGDAVKREGDIVGFFDIDNASYSKKTREFLNLAEKEGRIRILSSDIPVSFILSADRRVILTRAASKSLKTKRGLL